jgi:hypothetical protein
MRVLEDPSSEPDYSVADAEIIFHVQARERPAPPSGSSAACFLDEYVPGGVYVVDRWPPNGVRHVSE